VKKLTTPFQILEAVEEMEVQIVVAAVAIDCHCDDHHAPTDDHKPFHQSASDCAD
jgi:tartrate dehydratase beta subunit/fumarate hydratase class I family protein